MDGGDWHLPIIDTPSRVRFDRRAPGSNLAAPGIADYRFAAPVEIEVNVTYEVTVKDVPPRPTAVIAAETTWSEFPSLWGVLLGQVWACLRSGGINGGCPNVMLYLDDTPRVEVGVELTQPCVLTGPVVASKLPAGQAAFTVHCGSYRGLAAAHRAVHNWCEEQGFALAGPRWEIYGPHLSDPSQLSTEIYWLLS